MLTTEPVDAVQAALNLFLTSLRANANAVEDPEERGLLIAATLASASSQIGVLIDNKDVMVAYAVAGLRKAGARLTPVRVELIDGDGSASAPGASHLPN